MISEDKRFADSRRLRCGDMQYIIFPLAAVLSAISEFFLWCVIVAAILQ